MSKYKKTGDLFLLVSDNNWTDRDKVLVAKSLEGDIEAFATLVRLYQERLYNFLYKMALSREDTEEIVQETFIKAYNNLYKYDSRWSFSTWIFRIAINTFRSDLKKKKRHQQFSYFDDIPELSCAAMDVPDAAAEINELRREIALEISKLKTDQKTALILKHLQGFSYKEIGNILGISAEAAKMKVQRAKETLCRKLGSQKRGVYNELQA